VVQEPPLYPTTIDDVSAAADVGAARRAASRKHSVVHNGGRRHQGVAKTDYGVQNLLYHLTTTPA